MNTIFLFLVIEEINPSSTNVHFYTPWKHQKTGGFLMFRGGIEVEDWLKMG